MRKPLLIALLATLAGFSAAATAADLKIAAIRSAELILQSPQYKTGQDKMKQEFEKRSKDLETEGKKLQDDVKKFQKEADLLSAADRAKQEKDLNTRNIDFNYKQKQFQEDVQSRDRQLTQDMRAKIQEVIVQVSKEKGYDLVVQDPVFASAAVDITDEVLKKLGGTPDAKAKK